MKSKVLNLKLLTACVFLAQPAFADTTVADQKIIRLGIGWGESAVYIQTDNPTNTENCTDPGNRFYLSKDHPMEKEMMSMLLLALNSDLRVNFRVRGCAGGPNTMNIIAISIRK